MSGTALLFLVLTGAMAVFAALMLRRCWSFGAVTGVLLAYLAVPGVLAARHALDRYTPLPAPGLIVLLVLTLGTMALAFSPLGLRLTVFSFAGLAGFQAFRIGVEFLLHRLYLEGVVPVEMTYTGRNFDIISGMTGGFLGLWLARRPEVPRALVLGWNLLGLLLLVNIVVIAVLATPVPFRRFTEGPANLLPSTFPYVWLPSFLVQAALFGHLLVFRKLRASARA